MGTFIYGTNGLEVDMEDRILVHLREVIVAKLRKHESFCFTIPDPSGGTVTVWIDCAIPVAFRLSENHTDALNGAWLLQLAECANQSSGLYVTEEPPLRVPPIRLVR
jgi:hypothetical protein